MNMRLLLLIAISSVLVGCTFQPDLKGEWGWSESGECSQSAPRLIVNEKIVEWVNENGTKGKGVNASFEYYMENSSLGRIKSATLAYDVGRFRITDYFEIKWHLGDPSYRLVSRHSNKKKIRDRAIPHLNESLVACN